MQLKKEKILDDISDINIDIYLIGYKQQGESIIFVLYANKPKYKILYSVVIDCYSDDFNVTEELLKEISVDKIDMLIWTHPHDDHTKGIVELIDNFCSKNTKIVLANVLGQKTYKLSKECQKVETKISNLNKRQKNKYDMVHIDNLLKEISFMKADTIKNMKIKCIAPIPSINSKQASKGNVNLNDICVAVIIELILVNGKTMNFLFASDLENEVLSEIYNLQEDCEIPHTYNFIKIPHHGGRSAENIKNIFDGENKSEYAATTVFMKEGESEMTNPDIRLLNEYKEYVESVGCTSDLINKVYDLGILRVNYQLQTYSTGQKYIIDTFGSAVETAV